MADLKISQMPSASALTGSELMPVVQSSNNRAATITQIRQLPDGQASSPSLTFNSDTNTGIYRIGSDILGFSTNGVERTRITNSGMQVTGLLSGTAVTQSATDTTAGRLLKVGDYGLGPASANNFGGDIDTITYTGFVRLNSGWTSPSSTGVTTGASGDFLFTMAVDASNLYQILTQRASSAPRMLYRTCNGGTWSPWREVYNAARILGTVSQSGGIPTGAIMQGNATQAAPTGGWTERLADGFQTVHHSLTSSAAGDTTWTYNSAFLAGSTPVIGLQPVGDADYFIRLVSRNATSCVFSIRDSAGNRVAVPVDATARGRWSNMT